MKFKRIIQINDNEDDQMMRISLFGQLALGASSLGCDIYIYIYIYIYI
jgi:hypothetical protein